MKMTLRYPCINYLVEYMLLSDPKAAAVLLHAILVIGEPGITVACLPS